MATQFGIVSFGIFDDIGVTVPHDIFVTIDDSKTVAQVLTELLAYGVLADAITDGASLAAHVTIRFDPTGFKVLPAAGKAVDTTGLFTFAQSSSPNKWSIDMPAIADAVIVAGKIDPTNAAVAAWVDWFAAAHNGVRGVSKYSLNLAGFRRSVITTRKHRRSLARISTSVTT